MIEMTNTGAVEHLTVMETRIARQIEEIERLRLFGKDISEATRRLKLLRHALDEMRLQLGHLSLSEMDIKRADVSLALALLSQKP